MYCTNCGEKLKENANYCTNCGKIVDNKVNYDRTISSEQQTQNNIQTASLIIGIVSIFSVFIFNVFVIPLAVMGLILGLRSKKKINVSVILNIMAIILAIVIFVIFVFLIINVDDYIEDDSGSSSREPYIQERESNSSVIGKWYLYDNNQIYEDNYFLFNMNNTYTWVYENESYIGNYTIEYGITQRDGSRKYSDNQGYSYYNVVLIPISLRDSSGNIQNSNLEKTEFVIGVNGNNMKAINTLTNDSFTLQKEILEMY